MQQIILTAEAGQISAELTRRGIAADARVHVTVERRDDANPPMAAIVQSGKVFDWLDDEPDLYSDAVIGEAARRVFAFGRIVLARFLSTDLFGDKRRPALVASRDNDRRSDRMASFITLVPRGSPDMAPLALSPGTGLKVPSVVRFDTLATLDGAVIAGRLGGAPADWLAAQSTAFVCVFGFHRA